VADQAFAAAGVEDAWPLTPAQTGMLFHTRAAPESGVYVGQFSALLPADLDLGRFKAAWEEVIARHGALRSLILWEGFDEPVQVVREALAPGWTELPGEAEDGERSGEAAFSAHLAAERARGIDLAAGPTSRLALQLRADGRWRFAWTCHHALVDAWSARLVLREAAQAYASIPRVAPAPQFRAFADWMAGRHAAAAEGFWRTQLADHAEPCRLQITPPIRPEPPGRESLRLPPDTLAALRAAASGLGATLSDLVQAAWAVVLHRATGRDDILFGVAATLRAPEIPGIEEIVGNFVTTLPARFRIDCHAALADLIRGRRETALAAMPHAHLAPAAFARLSGLPPGEALFETLVSMSPPEDAAEDGLFAELDARDQSSHPAALLVAPGEGLALTLVHDGARIGADGARRLLSMMGETLSRLPGSLADPPAGLPVMAPAALAAAEAGEAGPPLPDHSLVHAEIARRAQETPDAMAVVAAGGALTYVELDRQAALWARRLAARGLGPGDCVAVLMERGPLMPVALLATLKAGCAYVPLDAAYPEARITAMVEAAAPGAVLTTADLAARAPGALVLDRPADHLPESAPRPASPEDPAYVIFTSGSTGAPKGVVIRHRSLAASTAARGPVYERAPERFLLLSSFAFDSSMVGLFWTLASGGALHLPPPGVETHPAALAEIIAAQRITHTLCLPSVLDLLLNRPAAALASLDTVIAAGEPLPRAVADRFAAALPARAPVQRIRADRGDRLVPGAAGGAGRGAGSRSAVRSPAPASSSAMRAAGRSRTACRGSSWSAGPASPRAIWAVPT
jgi:non-ribosomal peptide synthetase component F